MTAKAIAIVAGVGPGTGASIARRFAKAYPVALLARNPANYENTVQEINSHGGKAIGISTDISAPESVKSAFSEIAKTFPNAALAAAVFNVGGGFVRKPFLELTEEEFGKSYQANVLTGFNFSQAAIPLLLKSTGLENPPTLIFTGATASMKGSSNFASLATGKFALRALSQSLAREFSPRGVHVSHVIVDGVIDTERTKAFQFDAPDAKLNPDSIAETYWYLHTQPRTAFTHEIDVRPYIEKW